MEVIVGKKAGFCTGVTNAVRKAEKKVETEKQLYCLGNLIHNEIIINRLKEKGLKFVETIQEVPDGQKVIFRAHGVPKKVYELAGKKNLKIYDLTCPKVLEIHKMVANYAEAGYYILVIGEKEHPEVIGTFGFCGNNAGIIEDQADVMTEIKKINTNNIRNIAIVSQTTFAMTEFDRIVEMIKRNIKKDCNLEVNKTICDATKLRQIETKKIAKQVDVMVILGGKQSSNTRKLYDIAVESCNNAMQVETMEDLYLNYLKRFKKVGVMAGASTPDDFIQEVVSALKETKTEDSIWR